MDNRLFSKCSMIAQVEHRYGNDPMWQPFFTVYDIAVPLSKLILLQCAEPTDEGTVCIEEAWLDLCRIVMVDPEGEYDLLDEMLAIGAIEDES